MQDEVYKICLETPSGHTCAYIQLKNSIHKVSIFKKKFEGLNSIVRIEMEGFSYTDVKDKQSD